MGRLLIILCLLANWSTTLLSSALLPETVNEHFRTLLEANFNNPYPSPDQWIPEGRAWGKASYALVALYLNQDVTGANGHLNDFYNEFPIPETESYNFEAYFKLHLIWRIYHDPEMNARLTDETRTQIETMMWRWINTRSLLTDAYGTEWVYHGSENHDAMQRGSFLLCAEALKDSPDYGPDIELATGGTLSEHAAAWTDYLQRFFISRAKEGINVEVASPTYAKYSVGVYFNLRDFAESEALRTLAENFLHLYWADTASDWTPSGVRGGAEARCYKDKYLQKGRFYSFFSYLRAYGWHNYSANAATFGLIPLMSGYRIPDSISAFARDTAKPNYLYTSRRWGLDKGDSRTGYNSVDFVDGNSFIRRETYVTPAYTMGTMTIDMNRDYVQTFDQNRMMGVFFSSEPDDRIVVYGEGAANDKSYRDLNGVCRENCMIVQRDRNVSSSGNDMLVYVSNVPWATRVESGGWIFMRNGSAYCALKPSPGTYLVEAISTGVILAMSDPWIPVIVQMGQSANYSSFEDFQTSVLANPIAYTGDVLDYTSEAGDSFTVYGNSRQTPVINGFPVDLNPALTYDSPLLEMTHGENIATVHNPGFQTIELQFSRTPTLFESKVLGYQESVDTGTSDPTHTITGFTVEEGENLKLVLAASWEQGDPSISATWNGGQPFTTAANSGSGRNSAILYLDNPSPGTSDIVVTFGAATASRISILHLQGMEPGYSQMTTGTGSLGNLTISREGTLVAGIYTSNGSTSINSPFPISLHNGNSGSSVGDAGFQFEALAGPKEYLWTGSNLINDNFSLVEFLPISTDDFSSAIRTFPLGGQFEMADDPDLDGISNAVELLFGTDPGTPSKAGTSIYMTGNSLVFSYPFNRNKPYDLFARYQWSTDLSNWYFADGSDGPGSGLTVTAYTARDAENNIRVTLDPSVTLPRLMMRIQVSLY